MKKKKTNEQIKKVINGYNGIKNEYRNHNDKEV